MNDPRQSLGSRLEDFQSVIDSVSDDAISSSLPNGPRAKTLRVGNANSDDTLNIDMPFQHTVLSDILIELKKLNLHLSIMTNLHIKDGDL